MSAEQSPGVGIEISLRIGQHVRHRDYKGERITGTVRGLSIDTDRVLQADIVLDAPIIIPARSADDQAIRLWHQHVPAHELAPFDDRDELIAEMLAALQGVVRVADRATVEFDAARAAIAKVQEGGAS